MRDWLSTELVQQAKRGNQKAYCELMRRNSNHVYAVCIGILGDTHEAEDITQDVFVKAYKEIRSLKKDGFFQQWISKIAKNLCYDWLRKTVKTRQALEDKQQITEDSPVEAENLKEALKDLDESYRTPLMLYYFEG